MEFSGAGKHPPHYVEEREYGMEQKEKNIQEMQHLESKVADENPKYWLLVGLSMLLKTPLVAQIKNNSTFAVPLETKGA